MAVQRSTWGRIQSLGWETSIINSSDLDGGVTDREIQVSSHASLPRHATKTLHVQPFIELVKERERFLSGYTQDDLYVQQQLGMPGSADKIVKESKIGKKNITQLLLAYKLIDVWQWCRHSALSEKDSLLPTEDTPGLDKMVSGIQW
jgi:hypothetical protein